MGRLNRNEETKRENPREEGEEHVILVEDAPMTARRGKHGLHRGTCSCGASSGGQWSCSPEEALKRGEKHKAQAAKV